MQKNMYHYPVIVGRDSSGTLLTSHQRAALQELSSPWKAAFLVFYALEVLFLTSAKLLVLDRMLLSYVSSLGAGAAGNRARKLKKVFDKAMHSTVVALNVVGLCANIVAAAYTVKEDAYMDHVTNSIQQFSEVTVLLLLVLAFAVVGIFCTRLLRGATGAAGSRIHLQITLTVATVFLTFLLRAIFACMIAVSDATQNNFAICSSKCASPCFNDHTLIITWLDFTPEFQTIVVLVSSPITMLTALWGMSSARMLQLMETQTSRMSDGVAMTSQDKQ